MSFGPPTSAALNNERPLIHTPVARLAEQIHLSIIRPRRRLRRVAMGFPCIHRYVSAGRYVSKVTWWHGILRVDGGGARRSTYGPAPKGAPDFERVAASL